MGFELSPNHHYFNVSIVRGASDDEHSTLLGAFSSITAAKRTLTKIVKTINFVLNFVVLKKLNFLASHINLDVVMVHALVEDYDSYNKKVEAAFYHYQVSAWPFKGSIAIKERCPMSQKEHYLIFNQWRHVGDTHSLEDFVALDESKDKSYQYDSYKILKSFFEQKLNPLV